MTPPWLFNQFSYISSHIALCVHKLWPQFQVQSNKSKSPFYAGTFFDLYHMFMLFFSLFAYKRVSFSRLQAIFSRNLCAHTAAVVPLIKTAQLKQRDFFFFSMNILSTLFSFVFQVVTLQTQQHQQKQQRRVKNIGSAVQHSSQLQNIFSVFPIHAVPFMQLFVIVLVSLRSCAHTLPANRDRKTLRHSQQIYFVIFHALKNQDW